jgi:hypothetical protein
MKQHCPEREDRPPNCAFSFFARKLQNGLAEGTMAVREWAAEPGCTPPPDRLTMLTSYSYIILGILSYKY